MTESTRREFTEGLRQIADFLDDHPEVPLPWLNSSETGTFRPTLPIILVDKDGQKETLAAIARAMGTAEKNVRGNLPDRFYLYRQFAGIALAVNAARDQVCERVVTGTREVEVEEPDPVALAQVPTVKKTVTIEDVEWDCKPLLAAPAEGGA